MTTRHTAAISGALSILVLTGCSLAPVEDAINNAVQDVLPEEILQLWESTADIPLELPVGASLPTSWPEDIPTPDGEVLFAVDDPPTWNVAIAVVDEDAAVAGAAALVAAGFRQTGESTLQGVQLLEFNNADYAVTYASITEAGQTVVNMTVTSTGTG